MAFTLRSDEGDDGGRLGRRSWVQAGAAGRMSHRGSAGRMSHRGSGEALYNGFQFFPFLIA
jgi:hypothetical protein